MHSAAIFLAGIISRYRDWLTAKNFRPKSSLMRFGSTFVLISAYVKSRNCSSNAASALLTKRSGVGLSNSNHKSPDIFGVDNLVREMFGIWTRSPLKSPERSFFGLLINMVLFWKSFYNQSEISGHLDGCWFGLSSAIICRIGW